MANFFEFMLGLLKEPAIMVGLIAFIGLDCTKSGYFNHTKRHN